MVFVQTATVMNAKKRRWGGEMRVQSSRFTYCKDSKTFVAEVSDFGCDFNFEPLYENVFGTTSNEVGIVLVSAKTGEEARFTLNNQMVDAEGELQGWELLPTVETAERCPGLAGAKVVILND